MFLYLPKFGNKPLRRKKLYVLPTSCISVAVKQVSRRSRRSKGGKGMKISSLSSLSISWNKISSSSSCTSSGSDHLNLASSTSPSPLTRYCALDRLLHKPQQNLEVLIFLAFSHIGPSMFFVPLIFQVPLICFITSLFFPLDK